ncbi:MAG: Photosynthesis system assembly factor, partial [Thermoleophilia bacterium]|nr:Photosynthesis system assembly factor [Thermoleophilia bacterium]
MLSLIAACVVACACAVASGASGATDTVVISMSVQSSTSVDLAGCTSAGALGLGSVLPGAAATTSTPCHIEFGANVPARLTMYQRDRSGHALTRMHDTLEQRGGVPRFGAVDNLDANDVWAGGTRVWASDPAPLKHTTNGGTTWSDVISCTAMGASIAHIVAWTSSEVSTIASNKLCRSTDTGATWTAITLPLTSSGRVFNPPGTDVLWLTTTTAGKLLRSADRGVTWSTITTPATTSVPTVVGWGTQDAVALTTVTASDQLSVTAYAYKTTDGGATWSQGTVGTIPVSTIPATTGTIALV